MKEKYSFISIHIFDLLLLCRSASFLSSSLTLFFTKEENMKKETSFARNDDLSVSLSVCLSSVIASTDVSEEEKEEKAYSIGHSTFSCPVLERLNCQQETEELKLEYSKWKQLLKCTYVASSLHSSLCCSYLESDIAACLGPSTSCT